MNTDEFLIKVDHNLTPSQRVQLSYFNTSGIQQQSPGGNLVWSQQNYSWRQQNANVSHTWTISPTKINQIWLNYTRMLAGRVNTPAVSLGDLGSSFTAQGTPSLPQITVTNYFTLSQSIAGPKAGTNFYSLRDVYSWNKGKHAFAFGGEGSLNKDIQQTLLNNYGVFSFNGTRAVTGCTVGTSTTPCPARAQNGLVDFMLGLPATMGQDTPVTAIDNIWFYGLFLQDDYKIKPNLTLNLGLRWDVQPASTEPQDRLATWLPGSQSTVIPNAPAGLLVVGDSYNGKKLPRGIVDTRYHHISPRVGFAWDPYGNGHTAIRGAGGLFYGSIAGNEWNATSNFLPFAVRNTYSNVTSLTDVYSDKTNFPNGNPYPYVYSPSSARFIYPAALEGIDPAYQWPYTYQFNLSIQQQFTRDFAMTVSYVSTLSHNVPFAPDVNYPIWSSTAKSGDQNSRRPFNPQLPSTTDKKYLSTVNLIQSKQKANYHGLQIDVEKRMGHGVSVKSFYVWSRTMSSAQVNNSGAVVNSVQDANHMEQEYGRSDTDVRHRSQTSIVWQPNYFASRGLLTRALLNGWTVSGIIALQSGSPFTVLTGADTNFDGITYDRANVVAGQPFRNYNYNHVDTTSKFFNVNAFCVYSASCQGIGPGGSDGNSRRNEYSGPGAKNINAALFRNFKLWESVQLQGRVEATNVFNFPNFSFGTGVGPTVNINNASAGTISSNPSTFPMRQLQVGARILF